MKLTKAEYDDIAEQVIAQVVEVIPWSSEEDRDNFIRSGARLFSSNYREEVPEDVVAAIRAASVTMIVVSITLKNLVQVLDHDFKFSEYLKSVNIPNVGMDNFLENLATLMSAASSLMEIIEK